MRCSPIAKQNRHLPDKDLDGTDRRNRVSIDSKSPTADAKGSGGLFRRVFGHSDPKASGSNIAESTLNLPDIQGFIVRGYRMPMVRHFLLTVVDPALARNMLGRLVSGNESDTPQITTAEDWHVGFEAGPRDNPAEPPHRKPDYCLNVAITWQGMIALQIKQRVPNLSFKSFGAFMEGAAARAKLVGDTGPSAP